MRSILFFTNKESLIELGTFSRVIPDLSPCYTFELENDDYIHLVYDQIDLPVFKSWMLDTLKGHELAFIHHRLPSKEGEVFRLVNEHTSKIIEGMHSKAGQKGKVYRNLRVFLETTIREDQEIKQTFFNNLWNEFIETDNLNLALSILYRIQSNDWQSINEIASPFTELVSVFYKEIDGEYNPNNTDHVHYLERLRDKMLNEQFRYKNEA